MPIVKLVSLLCFALLAMGSLPLLSACGGGLLPDQKAANASPFETYDSGGGTLSTRSYRE